jgi:hypothetical protein
LILLLLHLLFAAMNGSHSETDSCIGIASRHGRIDKDLYVSFSKFFFWNKQTYQLGFVKPATLQIGLGKVGSLGNHSRKVFALVLCGIGKVLTRQIHICIIQSTSTHSDAGLGGQHQDGCQGGRHDEILFGLTFE